MADSASESDSSSVEMSSLLSPSPSKEQLTRRNESLQQENRVLKMELDTYRVRIRSLQEENKALKQASVNILAKAEQEEEFISNTLMKQISTLKKEKEVLALNYEQEEECLTNDLSRKLTQLQHEKANLEVTLEQEQEALVNKLMRKIQKLENDIQAKQNSLEQLRREKVELENALEQEQENLVNKLWKRMHELEDEKRTLQEKLEQKISAASPPEDIRDENTSMKLTTRVQNLRTEISSFKKQLLNAQQEYSKTMAQLAMEERKTKEANLKLQKKVEQRQALSHHLSGNESSHEMDDGRHDGDLSSRQSLHTQGNSSTTIETPFCESISSSLDLNPGNKHEIAANQSTGVSYISDHGGPICRNAEVEPTLTRSGEQHIRIDSTVAASPISEEVFAKTLQK